MVRRKGRRLPNMVMQPLIVSPFGTFGDEPVERVEALW